MTNPDPSPAAEFVALLQRLRKAAGLSQSELGRRINVTQTTISRFERLDPVTGGPQLLPTRDQRAGLFEALASEQVSVEDRRRLVDLAEDVAEEAAGIVKVRVALQRGVANLQRRLRMREMQARRMTTFHPILVPGLVQTEGYIRAVAASGDLGPEETERFVRERLDRQAQMAEPGRRLTVILTEGTLMWGTPGPGVMAEQCEHLAELATSRDAWTIAVIPAVPRHGRPVYPPSAFDLYDDRQVFVGTTAGNALTSDPVTVAEHVELAGRLLALAEVDADAVPVLERVRDRYRAPRS